MNLGEEINFIEWFEERHGKRPERKGITDLTLISIISNGEQAQIELRERKEYDDCRKHALEAWLVKDEEKQ